MKFKLSINQIFIYLLITSIVGGTYLFTINTSFFQLYGLRFFIPIALLFLLVKKKITFYKNKLTLYTTLFFAFWILYGSVQLFFSNDIIFSVKELANIFLGFLIYLILLSFYTIDKKTSGFFINGWVILLVVVFLFSFWEIFTQRHLESSLVNTLSNLGVFHDLHRVPVFTFDNPNHFAIYLSFSVCILQFLLLKNKYPQFVAIILVVCLIFMIILHARLGMIAFTITTLLFLLLKFIWFDFGVVSKRNIVTIIALASVLLVGIYVTHKPIRVHEEFKQQLLSSNKVETPFSDSLLLVAIESTSFHERVESIKESNSMLNVQGVDFESGNESSEGLNDVALSSGRVRLDLIENGLYLVKKSNYLGVGPGGFFMAHQSKVVPNNTGAISNPHNFFIEIISQYGVLVFGFFLFLLLFIVYKSWGYYKVKGLTAELFFIISVLICYVIMSNANSSFLSLPINWVMFSVLIIFSDSKLSLKNNND